MKKTLLILASALLLASCGGGGGDAPSSTTPTPTPTSSGTQTSTGTSSAEPVSQYTVTFVNAKSSQTIDTRTVDAGTRIEKPADPTYADHLFAGWFLDSGLTNEATFPLVVNSDLTVYAKFNSYIEHFLEARDKTILESDYFRYTSATNLKVSYSSLEFNGNQDGETRYNANSGVSFLETHENSGSLFYDGFKTNYRKGNTLFKISENEDHDVTGYETETVDESFRYDSSSFAKALFEYDENDITSVTRSGTRYELMTNWNFSRIASLILSQVNSPIVQRIIGQLPENASDFILYVTFDDNGYLSTYSYEFVVEVSGVNVSATYNLTFVGNGQAPSITEPSFPNLYLSNEQINDVLGTINGGISTYKAQEYSAYNYRIDSTVVTPQKSVGVTSQGKTMRKVQNSVVYYNNRLEVDSELKDDDMYGPEGVEDYERYRAKLLDGTVYDAEDRTFPLSNVFTEVTTPLAGDDFYALLPSSYLTSANIDAVQKTSETAFDEYSLVINQEMFVALLNYVNDITRMDPTLAKHYLALGTIDEDTVVMTDASFLINLSNGVFTGMTIYLDGSMSTSYDGTTIGGDSTFELSITIETTDDGANYQIPETTDDIELS